MPGYVGRFAPSPTGPLHFGSLVAALASYLDAKSANGRWLLRIEDLDPPRESLQAPDQIKHQLERHGMFWDGELFQSTRLDAYEAALQQLISDGRVFQCDCTRKKTPPVYPGTCRHKTQVSTPFALRFQISATTGTNSKVPDTTVTVKDRLIGQVGWHLEQEVGDFIIRRKDGLFAYQLAVVVDDAFQGVTDVVRGSDLLDSTPRQVALIQALDYPQPQYLHFPVLVDGHGDKLSKQAHAPAVSSDDPVNNLLIALKVLGQKVPDSVGHPSELLEEAVSTWSVRRLPQKASVPAPEITPTDRER